MTARDLIHHEWKTRLSRPTTMAFLALFTAATIAGALNGRRERATRQEAIADHRADTAASMSRWRADLEALHRGDTATPPWAGSAMDVTLASYLPPAPLGDFAIGQSDLLPYQGAISLWNPDLRLFARYQLDEPVSLAQGGFDLSKAILFLLPLLLIALNFDVLSAERDTGRLDLQLAHGATLRKLLWTRLLIRGTAALGLTSLLALAALAAPSNGPTLADRTPFFLLWILGTALYGLFWLATIALVAARNRSGLVNILTLALLWATATWLVPASATAIAEALDPPPSRLTYLAEAREKEIQTERQETRATRKALLDHPDLAVDPKSDIPAYVRTAFLVMTAVDQATKPIQEAFDRTAADREATLDHLSYLSPAILLHELQSDIAGTSSAQHRRYATAARALKATYANQASPAITAGRRLTPTEAANLPTFHLDSEPASTILQRQAPALLFLALATGLLALLADRTATTRRP